MSGSGRNSNRSKGADCLQTAFFIIVIALVAINEFKSVSDRNAIQPPSNKSSAGDYHSALRGNLSAHTDEGIMEEYKKNRLRGIILPSHGRYLIHLAAELDRGELIKMLVERGQNVNSRDAAGNTPLHIALENKSEGATKALLALKADLLAANKHEQTILHFASRSGSYETALAAVKAGAKVNYEAVRRWQPLHYAASNGHMRIVVLLVENGADLTASIDYGWTAGDMCFEKHKPVANFLHSRNARFSKFHLTRNYGLVDGWPLYNDKQIKQLPYEHPVFRAIADDSPESLANLVAENANLNLGNNAETPALCLAIAHNSSKAAGFLIDHLKDLELADANGKTALIYAIESGNKEIARLLMSKKVNLSVIDISGNTPLHYAIARCDNDIAAELIEKGADIFAVNFYGRGMMHTATENGNEIMFATLINNGCDVNLEDVRGNTPLHLAVINDNLKITTALLKNGADFGIRNHAGKTPVLLAKSTQIRQLLSNRYEVEGVNPAHRPVSAEVQMVPVSAPPVEKPEIE